MISAKEAREMYEKSNARIAKYLETDVEPHVLKAVEAGKCQCGVYIGAEPSYKSISPNPFQQSVIEELKKLGYRVRFGSFEIRDKAKELFEHKDAELARWFLRYPTLHSYHIDQNKTCVEFKDLRFDTKVREKLPFVFSICEENNKVNVIRKY